MNKFLFLLIGSLCFTNLYAGTPDNMPSFAGVVLYYSTAILAPAIYAVGLWVYVLIDVWEKEDLSGKILFTLGLFILHIFTVLIYILFKKRWNVVKTTILFYLTIALVILSSGVN